MRGWRVLATEHAERGLRIVLFVGETAQPVAIAVRFPEGMEGDAIALEADPEGPWLPASKLPDIQRAVLGLPLQHP